VVDSARTFHSTQYTAHSTQHRVAQQHTAQQNSSTQTNRGNVRCLVYVCLVCLVCLLCKCAVGVCLVCVPCVCLLATWNGLGGREERRESYLLGAHATQEQGIVGSVFYRLGVIALT
jgi:hypothetical protein